MSDEQLVATNEELVKRLRPLSWSDIDARFGVPMDKTMREAADRIELLATTNEQLVATNEALTAELATCEKYRDAYAECDRIGTQTVRDLEAVNKNQEAMIRQADRRGDALEAKLAECEARLGKAVEALRFGVDLIKGDSIGHEWKKGQADFRRMARTTLAEIERSYAT